LSFAAAATPFFHRCTLNLAWVSDALQFCLLFTLAFFGTNDTTAVTFVWTINRAGTISHTL